MVHLDPLKLSPLQEFVDEICAIWDFDRGEVANIVSAIYYQRGSIKTDHLVRVTRHFTQLLNQERLKYAFTTVIERHPILHTVFMPFQNTFIQVVLRRVDISFERRTPEHLRTQRYGN
ncbi:unnamed protein product [Penicillium salamii]|nr:unnamed protein product [Penicillium salamii]